MAVLLRHLTVGIEGSPDGGKKSRKRGESQIVGGQPRRQQKSKICRRNAMRDSRSILLDDIGNQPILFGSAELAKKAPGSQPRLAQHHFVPGNDATPALRAPRLIEPTRNCP